MFIHQKDKQTDRQDTYHRLNGSSSSVLTVTSLSYGKAKNSTLTKSNAAKCIFPQPTPVAMATKFGTKWAITRLA